MVLPNFVPSFQVLKEMMIRSKQLLFEIVNLLPTFTSEEPRPKMNEDIARLKKLVLKQHCYLRILIRYISSKMNCMEVGPGTKNSRPSSCTVHPRNRQDDGREFFVPDLISIEFISGKMYLIIILK